MTKQAQTRVAELKDTYRALSDAAKILRENAPNLRDYAPSAWQHAMTLHIEREKKVREVMTSLTQEATAIQKQHS